MEWLGFFMLGFLVGVLLAAAASSNVDKKAAARRIWQHDGAIYKLTEIDPDKAT